MNTRELVSSAQRANFDFAFGLAGALLDEVGKLAELNARFTRSALKDAWVAAKARSTNRRTGQPSARVHRAAGREAAVLPSRVARYRVVRPRRRDQGRPGGQRPIRTGSRRSSMMRRSSRRPARRPPSRPELRDRRREHAVPDPRQHGAASRRRRAQQLRRRRARRVEAGQTGGRPGTAGRQAITAVAGGGTGCRRRNESTARAIRRPAPGTT